MKNRLIILFVFLSGLGISCQKSSTPTPPPASDVHLNNGLLVYLPFDGNFADSSGNGNTVTPVNGASLTYDEHGYANSAFGGTGNGERLLVTNNGSIKFDTAFTLSIDVMTVNFELQDFVTMVQNNTGSGVTFGVGLGVGTTNRFDFAVSDSTAGCNDIISGSNSVIDTTQFIVQPESWYNIVSIFHKGTLQIYVNGKLVSTQTGANTTVPICTAAQLIVGGWWQGAPTASLNGKLDEVRLYNRVLNADEIAQLASEFQQDQD